MERLGLFFLVILTCLFNCFTNRLVEGFNNSSSVANDSTDSGNGSIEEYDSSESIYQNTSFNITTTPASSMSVATTTASPELMDEIAATSISATASFTELVNEAFSTSISTTMTTTSSTELVEETFPTSPATTTSSTDLVDETNTTSISTTVPLGNTTWSKSNSTTVSCNNKTTKCNSTTNDMTGNRRGSSGAGGRGGCFSCRPTSRPCKCKTNQQSCHSPRCGSSQLSQGGSAEHNCIKQKCKTPSIVSMIPTKSTKSMTPSRNMTKGVYSSTSLPPHHNRSTPSTPETTTPSMTSPTSKSKRTNTWTSITQPSQSEHVTLQTLTANRQEPPETSAQNKLHAVYIPILLVCVIVITLMVIVFLLKRRKSRRTSQDIGDRTSEISVRKPLQPNVSHPNDHCNVETTNESAYNVLHSGKELEDYHKYELADLPPRKGNSSDPRGTLQGPSYDRPFLDVNKSGGRPPLEKPASGGNGSGKGIFAASQGGDAGKFDSQIGMGDETVSPPLSPDEKYDRLQRPLVLDLQAVTGNVYGKLDDPNRSDRKDNAPASPDYFVLEKKDENQPNTPDYFVLEKQDENEPNPHDSIVLGNRHEIEDDSDDDEYQIYIIPDQNNITVC